MNLIKTDSVDVHLSVAARQRLRSLINSLVVCEIKKVDRPDNLGTWMDEEARLTVALFDEFGVELPCLNDAQHRMEGV